MAELMLLVMLVIWLVVEGAVILTAASALLPAGALRLTRLGAVFLGTEAWTLALLGAGHATLSGPTHEVLHEVGWALAVFVAGWMLRDLGLWLGPRSGAGSLWRLVVAVGAIGQIVGLLALIAGWLVVRPELTLGAGAGMLLIVVPPVLLAGLVLLVALWRLSATAGYFNWTRPRAVGSGPLARRELV